jgi:hypothetical protein
MFDLDSCQSKHCELSAVKLFANGMKYLHRYWWGAYLYHRKNSLLFAECMQGT